MTIYVNGEQLPPELIAVEQRLLGSHPDFRSQPDSPERDARLQQAAEDAAINRMLMTQAALASTKPPDDAALAAELQAMRRGGAEVSTDDPAARTAIAARVRFKLHVQSVRDRAADPSDAAIRAAYGRHGESLTAPERIHAAHIVKHTGQGLDEPEAREKINAALRELEAGVPFEEVANRYSDCPGAGGDLGWFPRGKMVPRCLKTPPSRFSPESAAVL